MPDEPFSRFPIELEGGPMDGATWAVPFGFPCGDICAGSGKGAGTYRDNGKLNEEGIPVYEYVGPIESQS